MPFNPKTNQTMNLPTASEELKIYPEVFQALKDLQKQFKLFRRLKSAQLC